jgi:peptide/nickel transport system permease protein
VGAVLSLLIVVVAAASPLMLLHDPLAINGRNAFVKPGDSRFPLGTDRLGRDLLSRLLLGSRVSVLVGLAAPAIGLIVGSLLGMVAGLYRGTILETLLMRLVDSLLTFPGLIVGLVVVGVVGGNLPNLIFAIGLVLVPRFARLAYGCTLTVRESEYVAAARSMGAGPWRVLSRHIWPNIRANILAMALMWVAVAINTEASLSFIGLGIAPPTPTWGNITREGMSYFSRAPWISAFAGLAILLTNFAFSMFGDGLRDITDPKTVRE